METKTLTLAEFLLARIAEDEAEARDLGVDAMTGHRWKHYPQTAYEELQSLALKHARRVTAECDAKRRIVELHQSREDGWLAGDHTVCVSCGGYELVGGLGARGWQDSWPCKTLRLLAIPYADHPDFRDEWQV